MEADRYKVFENFGRAAGGLNPESLAPQTEHGGRRKQPVFQLLPIQVVAAAVDSCFEVLRSGARLHYELIYTFCDLRKTLLGIFRTSFSRSRVSVGRGIRRGVLSRHLSRRHKFGMATICSGESVSSQNRTFTPVAANRALYEWRVNRPQAKFANAGGICSPLHLRP
jgi:hypothetical protein